RPFALGELIGLRAKRAHQLARHADEPEIAKPGGGAQRVTLMIGELVGRCHLRREFDERLRLSAENRIVGGENSTAELERVFVARREIAVGGVEALALLLELADFCLERSVRVAELRVEALGFGE